MPTPHLIVPLEDQESAQIWRRLLKWAPKPIGYSGNPKWPIAYRVLDGKVWETVSLNIKPRLLGDYFFWLACRRYAAGTSWGNNHWALFESSATDGVVVRAAQPHRSMCEHFERVVRDKRPHAELMILHVVNVPKGDIV